MVPRPVKSTIVWMPIVTGPGSVHSPILYCTTNGKLGTLKEVRDWDWQCKKYSIKYWTYQNDIKPIEFR